MSKHRKTKKELKPSHVLAWFGDDEKEEIAIYLCNILKRLNEEKSPIGVDLYQEVLNYE